MSSARTNKPLSAIPSNTLRLGEADLGRIRGDLDTAGAGNDSKRDHLRWPFPANAVKMEVRHPGGQATLLAYACRNLSCGGMSLLHSSYVHVGTLCTVHLPRANGTVAQVAGKIVRCRHVKGTVHEIGVAFKGVVNISEFIRLDPYEGRFSLERIDPERLSGTLLHIEDSEMDRRLVRNFLKDTNLFVVNAEDAEAALVRVGEGFDVILCDINLTGMSGIQFCEQLRAKGIEKPVIMVSADVRGQTRAQIKTARANAFLAKPFSRDMLFRALGEFLLADGKGSVAVGSVQSTLSPDDPTYTFIPEFVEGIHAVAAKMNPAIAANNTEEVRRLCMSVISGAGVLGFSPVAEAAQRALGAVNRAAHLAEAADELRTFVYECLRARKPDEVVRKADEPVRKAA
ncbi:MAG: response regulator [Phycisphaerales bacterium]